MNNTGKHILLVTIGLAAVPDADAVNGCGPRFKASALGMKNPTLIFTPQRGTAFS